MSRLTQLAAGLALCAGLAAQPAQATLVLDITSGGSSAPCGGGCGSGKTYGWSFHVNNAFDVDGLGVWDAGADGLGVAGVPVGLWNASGTLLASVTVTSAGAYETSAHTAGDWLFMDIPTLTLAVGDYVIGSIFYGTTPLAQVNATRATIADITYGASLTNPANTGALLMPTASFGSAIYGPTLRQADAAAAVPEPESLALLGLGLAALAMSRGSRRAG